MHLHGYVAMAGNYILMMFYTSVAGWMLDYFVRTAGGQFVGATPTVWRHNSAKCWATRYA